MSFGTHLLYGEMITTTQIILSNVTFSFSFFVYNQILLNQDKKWWLISFWMTFIWHSMLWRETYLLFTSDKLVVWLLTLLFPFVNFLQHFVELALFGLHSSRSSRFPPLILSVYSVDADPKWCIFVSWLVSITLVMVYRDVSVWLGIPLPLCIELFGLTLRLPPCKSLTPVRAKVTSPIQNDLVSTSILISAILSSISYIQRPYLSI